MESGKCNFLMENLKCLLPSSDNNMHSLSVKNCKTKQSPFCDQWFLSNLFSFTYQRTYQTLQLQEFKQEIY